MRIVVLLITAFVAFFRQHSLPGDPFMAAVLVMAFVAFSEKEM